MYTTFSKYFDVLVQTSPGFTINAETSQNFSYFNTFSKPGSQQSPRQNMCTEFYIYI